MEVGDHFNETDEDVIREVTEIRVEDGITPCTKIGSDSEDTEEECDLSHVEGCVNSRKKCKTEGFADYDVYDIYKMNLKELKQALKLAKQSTTGPKVLLCDHMIHALQPNQSSVT